MAIGPGNVQFTYAQLEGIWIQAGGNKQYAAMAAAISMAESGGNSAAYGVNTNGTTDRGLWQINSSNGSLSTFDIMGNARSAIQMSNNGTNWRPWCTAYGDGACGTEGGSYLAASSPFQKFLQGAVPPDLTAPINGTQAASGTTGTSATTASIQCSFWESAISPGLCAGLNTAGGAIPKAEGALAGSIINTLIGSILNPMIQLVAGIMGITGGGALMVGGIFLLVKETQAYQEVKQTKQEATGALSWLAGPEAGAAVNTAQGAQNARQRPRPQQQQQQQKQLSTQDQLRRQATQYGRVET